MTVAMAKRVMAAHAADLTPAGRALLRHLAVLARPDGGVRWAVSDIQLQRELGLGRTAVKAARRQLVDEHLVDVLEVGTGRHATVYKLLVGVASSKALPVAVGAERSDPQGVDLRPSGGRNPTPSDPVAPLAHARTVSTTYGLCEAPPAPPATRSTPPPSPAEGVDRVVVPEAWVDEFLVALPEQLMPRSGFDRVRMLRAIAPLAESGWPPEELAIAVTRVAPLPYAVISGVGLLESRLRTVDREQSWSRARPAEVPWCGDCDEHNRWVVDEAGLPVTKCPRCHPGARAAAEVPF